MYTLYAFAADKVVDYRLKKHHEKYQLGFNYEDHKPGISVAFHF